MPAGKVLEYGAGDMFGELALMYNAQRAATVSATADGKLWGLDRDSFQLMLTTAENTKKKQYEGFLENVAILQDLTAYEMGRLSDMLNSELFDKDEVIITQGESGNYFYILEDGAAKAFIGGEKGEIEVKHYEKPGEYFGEIALLTSATRRATVRAAGEGCSVLSVSRADFDLVLGPIKDILGHHLDKYPQYANFITDEQSKAVEEEREKEKIENMKNTDRRQGVSAQAMSEERMKDWIRPSYPKPQDQIERLKGIIASNAKLQVLFGHLTEGAVNDVIDAMKPQDVEINERLIVQGDEGNSFYIVDEGTFDVFVQRGDNAPGKVCDYNPGAMFGELALMYNAPRAATVTSTSVAKVWALDRESFQLMLTTAENTRHTQYEGFLQEIDLFKHLTRYEIAQLSDLLQTELFEGGEEIVKQGEDGKTFYIVEDGEAKAFLTGDSGEVEVKHYQKQGEYFGEIALITNGPRKATVRAIGSGCSVLTVSREDFDRVLGPIKDILIKDIDNYPAYADVIREAMKQPEQ
jgi:cAMP-dependent protein kinase regulator